MMNWQWKKGLCCQKEKNKTSTTVVLKNVHALCTNYTCKQKVFVRLEISNVWEKWPSLSLIRDLNTENVFNQKLASCFNNKFN